MVPSQLKVLIAEGTPMIMVVIMNPPPRAGFIPDTNIWWPHTIQGRKAIDAIAVSHRPIAENRFARERCNEFRRNPHRRQNHDVNFGMAEEPEQMLPQQRLAAPCGDEEMRPGQAGG